MSMTVYQTDVDGFLVGLPLAADPDPLDTGNWLIPARCVGTQPPTLAANETAQWVNGGWVKQPDYQWTTYWLPDGSQHQITQRGIAPPANALTAPPPPTADQVIASLTAAVQAHLDATARTRNYDGILSLCSYAASTNPKFGPEGLAGVAWRDAVWAACYAVLAAVQAGTRTTPTAAELLAELPAMAWPA